MRQLLIYLCFLMNMNVFAKDADDFIKQLNNIKSMQAEFVQTVYDNHNKAVQHSYGKMAFVKPGQFRWEVLRPIPQLIVANQNKLWIYDKDLEQVTIRKLNQATGETPALLLSHQDTSFEQEFIIEAKNTKKASESWFKLLPRQEDNMFKMIELGFSNHEIKAMILEDHLGHRTKVEFQHIQINKKLNLSLFKLKLPLGVDIIDETKKR